MLFSPRKTTLLQYVHNYVPQLRYSPRQGSPIGGGGGTPYPPPLGKVRKIYKIG